MCIANILAIHSVITNDIIIIWSGFLHIVLFLKQKIDYYLKLTVFIFQLYLLSSYIQAALKLEGCN